jgi:hypothetical protein
MQVNMRQEPRHIGRRSYALCWRSEDGKMRSAELASLEEHLLACAACVERVESTQDYVDALRAALVTISGLKTRHRQPTCVIGVRPHFRPVMGCGGGARFYRIDGKLRAESDILLRAGSSRTGPPEPGWVVRAATAPQVTWWEHARRR